MSQIKRQSNTKEFVFELIFDRNAELDSVNAGFDLLGELLLSQILSFLIYFVFFVGEKKRLTTKNTK